MKITRVAMLAAFALAFAPAQGQTLKVLSAGAVKEIVMSVVPAVEAKTGMKIEVSNATAGVLIKRVESGEAFDVVVVTHEGIKRFIKGGSVAADSGLDVASVGIGIGVREGASAPAIVTVDDLKNALHAAKGVAYMNPAFGSSSGIYLDGLFARLGIADEVHAKAVLTADGMAGESVAAGKADIVLQQVSEIVPVKGVTVIGLLPANVQNYTTYAAGVAQNSHAKAAAAALVDALTSAQAQQQMRTRGLIPANKPITKD